MEADNSSMLDLFRMEVEQQIMVLSTNLLKLEHDPAARGLLEDVMRAAHSIKGAARLVDVPPAATVAHVMEDVFVAAQQGRITLDPASIETLLRGTDLLARIGSSQAPSASWEACNKGEFDSVLDALSGILMAAPPVSGGVTGRDSAARPVVRSQVHANDPGDAVLADPAMMILFRAELEQQVAVLTDGLLALEHEPSMTRHLESLMRAAHSIKGAARLVDMRPVVEVAHLMEDSFVAAQEGRFVINASHIDSWLKGVDMMSRLAALDEGASPHQSAHDGLLMALQEVWPDKLGYKKNTDTVIMRSDHAAIPGESSARSDDDMSSDRTLRISTAQLNRLMGLAGEAMVEARWVQPYARAMSNLKRQQVEVIRLLDKLSDNVGVDARGKKLRVSLREIQNKVSACRGLFVVRLSELESFDHRLNYLSWRLRREVVASRMRPFVDGTHGFERMVRDVARSLGKDVRLEVKGHKAMVDREILDKIEAPLNHLLRNAVDHGIEFPDERVLAGKSARGMLRLSAYHQAGMLSIVVEDDGRGVDMERLRKKVLDRGLVSPEMAASLSEGELLEFLFLPGFTTREAVTEISGRGVGLDVVRDTVRQMRGMVRVTSRFGKGTSFQMKLPLTLSVIPALLVGIGGEPYAVPLVRIRRVLHLEKSSIESVEGHQYASIDGQRIGLVAAAQILDLQESTEPKGGFHIVVIGDQDNVYGLVVDHFIGERDLVIHVLPEKLGKVTDISAAALMEDGSPILIIDVDDMLRSIEVIVKEGRINRIEGEKDMRHDPGKHILVVDDSITVREVERKFLENSGYRVDVAIDGMDGWNAVRNGMYNLVITDIDMPRMDGIELVRMIKQDAILKDTPVMIVSYKDRAEDRLRGLNAGANYYLTKGSFHDDTLLKAVRDLIGGAV